MDADLDKETLTTIYETVQDRNVTFLAAGFTYYAFVSLIPLVVLALVVGSIFGGEALAERLVNAASDVMPAAGDELVADILTTESGRSEATVVALGVAVWGGLKVFRGLSLAFDSVYATDETDSMSDQIIDGVVVILAISLALVLMVVMGIVLRFLAGTVPFAGLLSWVILLIGLFLAFLPLYYRLPPISITIHEALPGAVFAAVGWVVLQGGFQLYAANAGRYEAYGALGGVLVFVTWLYFAGILILVGAVVNVVLSPPESEEPEIDSSDTEPIDERSL